MKRTLSAVLIALLLLSLCLTACAEETEPETFTSGDYTYILLEDGTVEICRYMGYSKNDENLIIPDTLDGHLVTAIGNYSFLHFVALSSITIPDSVTSIGEHAFSCCFNLASITIPDSVTKIGDDVFYWCSDDLTITVVRGSYAAQYCKENGLNYTYFDSLDWLNN